MWGLSIQALYLQGMCLTSFISFWAKKFLASFVNILLIPVAIYIVVSLLRLGHRWHVKLISIALILLAGIVAVGLELPEERIHLLEYGILGYIILKATSMWNHSILAALLFIAIIGSVDEGIQWLLPQRVGDVKDIFINWLGGVIGINVAWSYNKGT